MSSSLRTTCLRVSQWLTCSLLIAAVFSAATIGVVAGQSGLGQTSQAATLQSKGGSPTIPTLASMGQAVLQQDYTVEQLRRFRTPNGNVVTVRERLQVDANGTLSPQFALTFLGVEGEPAGSALSLEWQQTYARYGSLFFRHGSFQVRDLVRAASNYTLHDFGQVVRAGRLARRMVVFPNTIDKAIWVIDVDSLTNVPLFVAEFDNQLKVFAEIEVVQFTSGVQGMTAFAASQNVTPMADFQAAEAFLGSPPGLIDPDVAAIVSDYGLEAVEIHFDPINGRQKLVMSYTDGIDQFMVLQDINVANPFAGLPGTAANTIGRFRDPAVSALVFWDGGVSFHVAGRGSLLRLDEVARTIYRQALSN